MTTILMKNPTERALRIPSDFVADWEDDGAARPAKVSIPAGATVAIRAEYAARSRAAWTKDRGADPDNDAPTMVIDSPVSTMAPQLVPADAAAARFIAEAWKDELPSVRRAMEELKRKGAAERGELPPALAKPRLT
jgi:hypothetical protein